MVKTADNYSAGFWVFQSPQILDISPVKPGNLISPPVIRIDAISMVCDLLLIKTNFCSMRDREVYWRENPGIDSEIAPFSRENLPNLRVLGFDFISLSSFARRDIGKNAHRVFLDHSSPILPLEDVNLSQLNMGPKLKTVIVSPQVIEGADASPCTVLAQIEPVE